MKKINFANNSEPYLSAENLTQMQDNIEEAINGVVLFEGSTTGNVLLNNTSNYKTIKIFYKNGDGYSDSKEILLSNGIKASLELNYYNKGTQQYQHWTGDIEISGNTIIHSKDYYYTNAGGTTNAPQEINYISIEKVIGNE